MNSENIYLSYFQKSFKSSLKIIPKDEIQIVDTKQYNFHINEDTVQISGYDQLYAMTSFSTYPIVNGKKHGEPNADSIGYIRFSNANIMIIADGCGWGVESCESSRLAVKVIGEYLINNIGSCKTSKNIARLMIDSVCNAHTNIIEKVNKTKEASTTVLIAFSFFTKQPQLLILSIGDCQCFIHQEAIEHCIAISNKWNRNISETKESGGRIGFSTKKGFPDLKNVFVKIFEIQEDDCVILTTDGFSDNLMYTKDSSLDDIFSNKIIQSANMIDFIDNLSNSILEITQELRQFHQTNKNRIRPKNLIGKLDHSTIGIFRIQQFNVNLNAIDTFKSNNLLSLYPPNIFPPRSKSGNELDIEKTSESFQHKEIIVHTRSRATQTPSRELKTTNNNENLRVSCMTPFVYTHNPLFHSRHPRSISYELNESPDFRSYSFLSPELNVTPSKTAPHSPFSPSNSCFKKFFLKDEKK